MENSIMNLANGLHIDGVHELVYTQSYDALILLHGKLVHITITNPDTLNDFTELVRRGINTWVDAPVLMKELADLITVGHIQQDYKNQQ
jgi:hypothetical protein